MTGLKKEFAERVREEMMVALSEVARKNGVDFDLVRVYGLKLKGRSKSQGPYILSSSSS